MLRNFVSAMMEAGFGLCQILNIICVFFTGDMNSSRQALMYNMTGACKDGRLSPVTLLGKAIIERSNV